MLAFCALRRAVLQKKCEWPDFSTVILDFFFAPCNVIIKQLGFGSLKALAAAHNTAHFARPILYQSSNAERHEYARMYNGFHICYIYFISLSDLSDR